MLLYTKYAIKNILNSLCILPCEVVTNLSRWFTRFLQQFPQMFRALVALTSISALAHAFTRQSSGRLTARMAFLVRVGIIFSVVISVTLKPLTIPSFRTRGSSSPESSTILRAPSLS